MCTIPNITYVVVVISRCLASFKKEHWQTGKWILRYLKGIFRVCLCFRSVKSLLNGYTYVDIVGDMNSKKSTFNYLMTFVRRVVSSQSTLEKCIAHKSII